MAKQSSWHDHLSEYPRTTIHEPTGSTIEMVVEGRVTCYLDYHESGDHVIIRNVPGQSMHHLLEEFGIEDRHWVP